MILFCFFFQAEDGIRDLYVTGVQTCALPISGPRPGSGGSAVLVAWAVEVAGEAADAVEQLADGALREAVLPSRCPDGRQQPPPGPFPDRPRTHTEQLR